MPTLFVYNINYRYGIKFSIISISIINNLREETVNKTTITLIDKNLVELKNESLSKFNSLTRERFLDLAYKYLVFDKSHSSTSLDYRDLDED